MRENNQTSAIMMTFHHAAHGLVHSVSETREDLFSPFNGCQVRRDVFGASNGDEHANDCFVGTTYEG